MKKIIIAAALTASLSGCAIGPYQGGFLYTNMSIPVDVRDNAVGCDKKGESSAFNILGLFASGDAGIEKAKTSAGITKVGSVDVSFTQVLGIFSNSTTKVCGE